MLSDPEKRKAYDTFGSTNGRGPVVRLARSSRTSTSPTCFGGLFGGGRGGGARRGPQPERGADLQTEVHISFEDALAGVQVPVRANVETACHTCGGSGAEPGTAPIVCPECSGRGITSDSHGPLRALAAVPALPRQRDDRRAAVQDLPRLGPRAGAEDLPGEDSGGREGRDADPAQGPRRARPRRRPGRRSLRRRARGRLAALRAPRRRSRRRRSRQLRRRGTRREDRGARRPRGRSRSRFRPARSPGSCSR